jgi:hypothetical protein
MHGHHGASLGDRMSQSEMTPTLGIIDKPGAAQGRGQLSCVDGWKAAHADAAILT